MGGWAEFLDLADDEQRWALRTATQLVSACFGGIELLEREAQLILADALLKPEEDNATVLRKLAFLPIVLAMIAGQAVNQAAHGEGMDRTEYLLALEPLIESTFATT